ncbi:hypothetical protein E8E11_001222 [Didymella keratinophila]|nr:hypothetical protein E8E11_001222 [Didymella keratinophila]
MESSQRPRESNAQRDVGLTKLEYERFLVHTRVVAKRILSKLAEESSNHGEKLLWKDVDLQMGVEAVAQVNAQLAKEGIYGVDDDKIRFRLRKAMTDLQRSSKKASAEATTASFPVPNDKDRPYDPIRDLS